MTSKEVDDAAPGGDFHVVGLGASAGGLDALSGFFANMPTDSGMAFVVITHQAPNAPSLLAELLARETEMRVVAVHEPTRLEPNAVYVGQPGSQITVHEGVLQVRAIEGLPSPHMPIDRFFRSLARDRGRWAVGVVLSGTGSDGSLGLEEIKAELGMVMVQAEASAQHPGMPHSAIATDLVDFVRPIAELPAALMDYADAATARNTRDGLGLGEADEVLSQIFTLVRERSGHDFAQYKRSTVVRRIDRRMHIHRLETLEEYARHMRTTPAEVSYLVKELLIGVTSFFRDPEAWEALAEPIEELLANKPADYVVRAWVPACATGEEAYSLAILFREAMDRAQRWLSVQIFATDLNPDAIEVARAGVYPAGISADVTPRRLSRFFTEEDGTYRVKKELREMLVFAPQNIIADPPFTKLDLMTCRNLLIYLNAGLQKRLIPLFHYALKPKGLLMLGTSESLGAYANLFEGVDKKWKIFRHVWVADGAYVAEFPASGPAPAPGGGAARGNRAAPPTTLDQAAARMLLKDLVPPTVVLQERGDVVYVHGHTGQFLEPSPGSPARANIFNMARGGLQISLAAAIRRAASSDDEVMHRAARVKNDGNTTLVDLRVVRVRNPETLRGLLRVTFENARPEDESNAPSSPSSAPDGDGSPLRIRELERELQHTKESHQSTIEQLETANEELKSTNEELQSTNEELQSANEELETSKEEMQSLNEELQTVNLELQRKVDELSRANNDMKNLLNGTDIATVFLDNELAIKRYTDQAKNVIRLIPSDVGRPIGDLASSLHYADLVHDAKEVLRTLVFKEAEIHADNERCYLMRIMPYRTTDNVIDGLVLTFIDITKFKALQREQERLLANVRAEKEEPAS